MRRTHRPSTQGSGVNWLKESRRKHSRRLRCLEIMRRTLDMRDCGSSSGRIKARQRGGKLHLHPNALLMLVNLKANIVLVDYRGYGKSEGEPNEDGLYLDAEATLDYVMTRPDLDKTKVVLFGRSLGGAVAVRLASVNPHRVAAIIVENTFLSIPHMAATLFSFLPMRLLPLWCYRNQFLSYRHVALCRMPSLFVSGLSDQLIPPVMMKQLYELSPARTKRLAIFPEGTHNDTWQCQGYFAALEQFVKDLLKSHAHEESTQPSASVTII